MSECRQAGGGQAGDGAKRVDIRGHTAGDSRGERRGERSRRDVCPAEIRAVDGRWIERYSRFQRSSIQRYSIQRHSRFQSTIGRCSRRHTFPLCCLPVVSPRCPTPLFQGLALVDIRAGRESLDSQRISLKVTVLHKEDDARERLRRGIRPSWHRAFGYAGGAAPCTFVLGPDRSPRLGLPRIGEKTRAKSTEKARFSLSARI